MSYIHDKQNRLTRGVTNTGTDKRTDYILDKNGNRSSVERRVNAGDAAAAQTDTYTRTMGTNRLASVTTPAGTRSIAYDNRGNTASETRPASVSVTTAYDGYGRLTGYTRTGDATQANVYNGLDDRVQVTSGSNVRRYLYDGDGRLLGEYGASAAAANVTAEWIWLEPEAANDNPWGGDDGTGGYAPIAVAVGSTGTLNWVHTSHLGAPITYTTSAGAVTTAPTALLPGFPGQLRTFADLFYNRYRDYDPTTGRYVQADPIGLDGGENLYVYAEANPLRFIDPSGRFVPAAVVGGIVIGAAVEFGFQALNRWSAGQSVWDLQCYNWVDVGIGGALGAVTAGWGTGLKVTKGSWKWQNARRRIRRNNDIPGGNDLHHAFLPRRLETAFGGKAAPFVNHPLNLMSVPRELHQARHAAPRLGNVLATTPRWALGAVGSAGAGVGAEVADGD